RWLYPTGEEFDARDGVGRRQDFKTLNIMYPGSGVETSLVWCRSPRMVYEVQGLIRAKWLQLGEVNYGYPVTDELDTDGLKGRISHFRLWSDPYGLDGRFAANRSIVWSQDTGGAFEVRGLIREKWLRSNGTRVGLPFTDEKSMGLVVGERYIFLYGNI